MYDPGFPFLRTWLYGIGGFVVVTIAFAIGFVIATNNTSDAPAVEAPPASVAVSVSADDVIAVRPEAEPSRFPEFAPEGVIVVNAETPDAQAPPERAVQSVDRVTAERRAANIRRSRSPTAVARAPEPSSARASEELQEAQRSNPVAEASPDSDALAPSEASSAPQNEAAQYADERSWYGSAEYWREVEERRRAEREARRR